MTDAYSSKARPSQGEQLSGSSSKQDAAAEGHNDSFEEGYVEDEECSSAAEGSSTDEEEELREFGIYQCLPVPAGEPDFELGEPTTVEEYLRRVRWEAARLPPVVTGDIDQSQFDSKRTSYAATAGAVEVPECRPELRPSTAWLRAFLSKFSELRQQLLRESEQDPTAVAIQQRQSPSQLTPELKSLAGLDQVSVLQRAGAHLRRVVESGGLSQQEAAWVYAYSARIEKPLLADTCSLYRSLLRHCAQLRAQVSSPEDQLLPHLNVLIAIAGAYFGQDEQLAAVWEEEEGEG